MDVNIEAVYIPSEEIVTREIEGELIIVPLTAGIGDMEDELFSLNEIAKEIWNLLDGRPLKKVVEELHSQYDPTDKIQEDVQGLIGELLKLKIVQEV